MGCDAGCGGVWRGLRHGHGGVQPPHPARLWGTGTGNVMPADRQLWGGRDCRATGLCRGRQQPGLGLWSGAALTVAIWLVAGAEDRVPATSDRPAKPFRPDWRILILAFGLVAIGPESSLVGLGPTALIRAGVEEARAAELLSAFFVVFLLARVTLICVAHRVAPFLLYTLAIGSAALFALGAVVLSPAVFFVAMGAPAGLFFPGYYVTASARMGEDSRVTPPTIIAAGLVGAITLRTLLAPLARGWESAGSSRLLRQSWSRRPWARSCRGERCAFKPCQAVKVQTPGFPATRSRAGPRPGMPPVTTARRRCLAAALTPGFCRRVLRPFPAQGQTQARSSATAPVPLAGPGRPRPCPTPAHPPQPGRTAPPPFPRRSSYPAPQPQPPAIQASCPGALPPQRAAPGPGRARSPSTRHSPKSPEPTE